MKLFELDKVKKFFNILYEFERGVPIADGYRYKGYDKLNPNRSVCEKEVFVNRTINKWLKGKYLILYKTSEQTAVEYKQYLSITNISLRLNLSSGELSVYYYDYSKPMDIWNELTLSHNDILALEGEWCETPDLHKKLLEFFVLTLPEKEFIFKAYDFGKYPKRKKKGQTENDIFKLMETTISFKAKTEKEAYKKKKEFQENNKTKLTIYPSDILEIR